MISLLFRGVERPGGEKSEKGLDTPAAWPYPAAAMGSTAVQTDRPTLEPEPLEGRRQVPASDEIHTAAPGQIPTLQEVILDLEGTVRRLRLEQIEWHQQTNYWKALHERAVQREAVQKETIRDLESRVRALTHELKDYEELKAKHELLKQMHFGRKTEQQRERKGEESEADGQDKGPDPPDRPSRKRGQQPGRKGHGRKIRKDLPKEEIWHELPQEEQCCPQCSKCFEDFPGTEDSDLSVRSRPRDCDSALCSQADSQGSFLGGFLGVAYFGEVPVPEAALPGEESIGPAGPDGLPGDFDGWPEPDRRFGSAALCQDSRAQPKRPALAHGRDTLAGL